MPVTYQLDRAGRLVVTTCAGEVTLCDVLEHFRELEAQPSLLERLDSLDDASRAAMASPGAAEVRHATMPSRYRRIRRLADSIEPKLTEADRDRITRLLVVITASSSLRMWREHLGLSVDEVADEIDWIVRAAIFAMVERQKR